MFDACICVEVDEVSELLSRRRCVARKEHKCGECGHTIQPGDTYETDVTVFEGKFATYKTCLGCLRVRKSLFNCGWYYGGIWDDVHEAYCDSEYCICPEPPALAVVESEADDAD